MNYWIVETVVVFVLAHVLIDMSTNDTDDDQSELPGKLRTVTADMGMHPDTEMNVIGVAIFVILLVIMLPLLPVFVVGWVLAKIFSRSTPE